MFEIAGFEARRRVRPTLYLSAAVLAFAGLVLALFPSIRESGVDFQTYIESFPPELQNAFVGGVTDFTRIEGYLAVELYQWLWMLVLGVYFAYAAASAVAGEVESGAIDLVLTHPVSRTRVVVGKYLAFVPSVLAVNAITFAGTYLGVRLLGESIDVGRLLLLHGLSSVYLLACAAIGLVASVASDGARRAQMAAIGAVFATYLVDALTLDTDYEWLGTPAPSRYFDPTEILVAGEVDWAGIAVLVAYAVALVVVSAEYFERRDI
ncbi:ABC transporter permease [Natronomonas marina]|jgi:ABC-2 type transport system permease protein|uniref:ABC transporter permease n=1 Tax=Natronomonas marina TaxID=2961939 RepID=UPI0020C9A8F1|nr:ABC transporter permease subunit [Natronomonas marina]